MRSRNLSLACAIAASAVLPITGTAASASPTATTLAPAAVRYASTSATSSPTRATQKDQLLWILNSERARAGLAPLALRGGVAEVAREWAADLARSGRLGHRPNLGEALDARGVTGWRTAAENVGYGPHVADVHRAFMNSSGHRANILSSRYSQVGIGVTASNGVVWVTVDFVGY